MSFENLKFLWSFLLIFFKFFNSIVQKLKLKLVSSFDFFLDYLIAWPKQKMQNGEKC